MPPCVLSFGHVAFRTFQLLHARQDSLDCPRKAGFFRISHAAKSATDEICSPFELRIQPGPSGGGQLVTDIPPVVRVLRARGELLLHHAVEHDAQRRGGKPIVRGEGLEVALPVVPEGKKSAKPLFAHPPFAKRRQALPHVSLHASQELEKPAGHLPIACRRLKCCSRRAFFHFHPPFIIRRRHRSFLSTLLSFDFKMKLMYSPLPRQEDRAVRRNP